MATELTNDTIMQADGPLTNVSLIEDSEKKLVADAKSGSAAAFEQLVGLYDQRVFRLARKITRNDQDAEEVTQSAFLKAFRNLHRFRGDSRFYTWLVRITINEAAMKLRRRRYREVSMDDSNESGGVLIAYQIEDRGPNPEQRCSRHELQDLLSTSISQLEPAYRTVFELREVKGFSTEETARALALSLPAVKTRLQRARLQLRSTLTKHFKTAAPKEHGRTRDGHRVPARSLGYVDC